MPSPRSKLVRRLEYRYRLRIFELVKQIMQLSPEYYTLNTIEEIEERMNAKYDEKYRATGLLPYFESPAVNSDIQTLEYILKHLENKQ